MQKINTHLWFDTQAVEATEFYTSLFENSKITSKRVIKNTPSGDCDIVQFTLAGQEFQAISAGPYFKFNPSISLFVTFTDEAEIDAVWKKLIDGGEVMMDYQEYPWAKKYGWLKDKYGLTWQLSMSEHHDMAQKVTPALMYTKEFAGKAKGAIEHYTEVFPNSKVDMVATYEKGEGDVEGYIKHARFHLGDHNFIAMDSSGPHEFIFNEAISFVVNCDTQEEIDHYWEKLSAVPESEQCGWLKDKFGVSWQIVPSVMDTMMREGTEEQIDRVTQAFLKMKKFDISEIERAYKGE